MVDLHVGLGMALLAGTAGLAVLAVTVAQAAPMSQADFRSDLARIDTDYAAAGAACATQAGNAARLCAEEARSVYRLARAELDYRYSGRLSDQRHVVVVAANNAYAVARIKCADQAQGNRAVCVSQARSDLSKALAFPGQGGP